MAGNKTLNARNRAALDEWYTQLTDIEAELRHYRDQFSGKVVFCNCDDPYESNFFKFFAMSFNHLGLKRLITTCYAGSPISGEQLPLFETAGLRETQPPREPYKVVISEVLDLNEDGAIDLVDVEHLLRNDANAMTPLKGDGDFRSKECVALLDEADIVVTNPPFSLFREYINLLIDHGKQFLVLGDQNGATYSSIFPHIMANRLWFGYENGGTKWFRVPDDYEIKTASRKKVLDGVKYQSMGRIYWYTNLETTKRHEPLTLFKRYTPEEYPRYTNYPAIEVPRVAEMPMDYDGEMGVPITFLDKYNPDQFQIIGISAQLAEPMSRYAAKEDYAKNGKVVGGTGKLFLPLGNGKHEKLDTAKLERRTAELMQDPDVTKRKGIYAYLLTGEERHLSIRQFDDREKRPAYERQNHKCANGTRCSTPGNDDGQHVFEIDEMEGDHIQPWSKGGKTVAENCQMLCVPCNRYKGGL